MAYQDITYEHRGHGAWIRLNRPDAMNALTPRMMLDINTALDEAEQDSDCNAIVITGSGRAFCAGADLKFIRSSLSQQPGKGTSAFLDAVLQTLNRIESYPKPVIGAVNGLALAGGLELLLCCDLAIAVESARLGDAHANYGLLPGGGSSVRLPRKIGPTRAKYLLFTGEFVSAADLATAGLINEVVPDGELEAAVDRLMGKLATKSPLGLRRMKELVNDSLEQPKDTGLRLELLVSELHAHSFDMQEGLAAFGEKRKPKFQGR